MIPFVREMDFNYGRAQRVSPRIRRIVARNPGPFTFLGTGTYVVGEGEVAVLDPGPLDEAHLAALMAALEGERVTAIALTHGHADHAPLAAKLSELTGAPVYAGDPGSARKDEAAAGNGETVHLEEAYAPVRADRRLYGAERLCGPDWTLEVLPTPGHTPDHIAFALIEENALFCGDHVMGWSTTVVAPPLGDMSAYMASLDRVMARGFATLWPTHGPPVTDPEPFLAAYRRHRLAREAQILASLAEGPRRIVDMTPVLYALVDRRLWPAASLSMHAHLIDLTRRSLVEADPAPTLEAVYRIRD